MLSDLALTSPATDGLIIALRLFATVVLPLGAAVAVWNAWHVLRDRRRILAKLWALLLALACLFLLWIGFANHVIGFAANYLSMPGRLRAQPAAQPHPSQYRGHPAGRTSTSTQPAAPGAPLPDPRHRLPSA